MRRLAFRLLNAAGRGLLAGLEALFPDPVDDTMALAVSLGVVPTPPAPRVDVSHIPYVEQIIDWHAHPSHRPEFEDAHLGELIQLWGEPK